MHRPLARRQLDAWAATMPRRTFAQVGTPEIKTGDNVEVLR